MHTAENASSVLTSFGLRVEDAVRGPGNDTTGALLAAIQAEADRRRQPSATVATDVAETEATAATNTPTGTNGGSAPFSGAANSAGDQDDHQSMRNDAETER